MSKELLVIVPAYNEEKNIIAVVNDLKNQLPFADILVINDNSKDNTAKVLKENDIDFVTTPFNLRYAGVVQTGFKYAVIKDYKYAAQFDGDGQHIGAELAKMYDIIKESDIDIVIGSRFLEKTEYQHAFFRKIGTLFFQKIIKFATKQEITDPTSGQQILSRRVYTRYSKMAHYPDYPDANLIIEMLLKGYKIKEVPVKMQERIYGESMHAGIWGPFVYMIRMMYSIALVLIKYKDLLKIRRKN